jgi:hypothetical protein
MGSDERLRINCRLLTRVDSWDLNVGFDVPVGFDMPIHVYPKNSCASWYSAQRQSTLAMLPIQPHPDLHGRSTYEKT